MPLQSVISRHPFQDAQHMMLFTVHDILLPLFFLTVLSQWCLGYHPFHKLIGILITCVLSPLLFGTGMGLSAYIDNGDKYIFLAYGYSFMIYNAHVLCTGMRWPHSTVLPYLHAVGMVLQLGIVAHVLHGWIVLGHEVYFDFLSVLWYIPVLHSGNLGRSTHYDVITKCMCLGFLGTMFSFTTDCHWFRHVPMHPSVRFVLNQLPFALVKWQERRRP